jgi:hypothetical protein
MLIDVARKGRAIEITVRRKSRDGGHHEPAQSW